MKTQKFNPEQLGMLTVSLMKNLFPRPTKGQLLLNENGGENGSFTFYFTPEYHALLASKFQEAYVDGKFAQSNSEADWIDLMQTLNNAKTVNSIDFTNLTNHFLTV